MFDFLNTLSQLSAALVSLLAVVITVLLNWKPLKKAMKSKDIVKARHKVNLQKRKVIKAIPILALGISSWSLIRYTPIYEKIKKGLYYFLPKSKELVVNDKNGIIHHTVLCADHLPKKLSSATPIKLAVRARFHATHKVAILSELTKEASAEDAIEILLLAAEDSPTSVHIYDKIVKLLGKIKRYESIHILLEHAEANLIERTKSLKPNSKQYRKYTKAISHIQLQQDKAKVRARYAALRI